MENVNNNRMSDRAKRWLVMTAFVLFSASLIGGFYLFMTPGETVNLAFAYVVGLSMIVLPCTLPLAFVIVPLAMGKGAKKGFLMALFFGLGLSITLSLYGLFVAIAGKAIGLDQAVGSVGAVSRILFIIGGLAAFTFGLSELNLIRFRLPTYKGAYPDFIQKQGDYLKAFFLGLFLGNAGVGCPNPLFYVLLADIAVIGDVFNGWWLGFIHGIGRATPLIFLAILGILGVNAVSNIAKKTAVVTKWTGITLVLLGAFIFISGTSHQWYEGTIVHKGWNQVVELVTGGDSGIAEIAEHEEELGTPEKHGHDEVAVVDDHADSKDYIPAPWSWVTLLLMTIIPLWWYRQKIKQQQKVQEHEEEPKSL
ncbi:MAG: hypothetical protein BMS9Abin13_287 [Patescibacteria group bacterium]|nr:MAG: hypothetical protein BMS9Abin13_287 [Patescibacteria group bacterium]